MKKTELEALGLDAKTIKEIQIIHGKDMQALRAKVTTKVPNEETRSAIAAMLPMIHKKEHLTELLMKATYLYHAENRRETRKEAAPGATNTESGEKEPAPIQDADSGPIVPEGEGGCQV